MPNLTKAVHTTKSLPSFTPDGGSAINLGTDDAFITIENTDTLTRYTVQGRVMIRVNDDATGRDDAQSYVKNLEEMLNPVNVETMQAGPHRASYFDLRALDGSFDPPTLGTLSDPFTGLSVPSCACVSVSGEDEGFYGYSITVVFIALRTFTNTDIPVFGPTTLAGTQLGSDNTPYVIKTNSAAKFLSYEVTCNINTTTREDLTTQLQSLIDTLKPTPLERFDTADAGRQFRFAPDAIISNLFAVDLNFFTVSDVCCTSIDIDDDGGLAARVTYVFSKPNYTPVTTPVTDPRVAQYKGIVLGNQPSQSFIQINSFAFKTLTLVAEYEGTDWQTYASTIADALEYEQTFQYQMPRGFTGGRGLVKSRYGTPGTVVHDQINEDGYYLTGMRTSAGSRLNTVTITFTFTKGR